MKTRADATVASGREQGACISNPRAILLEKAIVVLDAQSCTGESQALLCQASESLRKQKRMIVIYHNPDCGTSRNTLAMIRASGEQPVVIEYLNTPPTREKLKQLLVAMNIGVMDLIRKNVPAYEQLKLGDVARNDDELIELMVDHPHLINRPIVETPLGTLLCRPSERVLDILPNPYIGDFEKEDGEIIPGRTRANQ